MSLWVRLRAAAGEQALKGLVSSSNSPLYSKGRVSEVVSDSKGQGLEVVSESKGQGLEVLNRGQGSEVVNCRTKWEEEILLL